jgi:hypothetical protein
VEWLEERCVFSVGVLDVEPVLLFSLRTVASFESIVVYENVVPSWDAYQYQGGIAQEVAAPVTPAAEPPASPAQTAIVDWGDGVVTGAAVSTDSTGQTVVTAERTLAPARTYDAKLLLADNANAENSRVVTFQITTAVPAPSLVPPPPPPVPSAPAVPVAPAPRPVEPVAEPEVTGPVEDVTEPTPPPPAPKPEQQPVVVKVTIGPPVASAHPQFEAGVVRASLAAPGEPTVSVTATSSGGAHVQVSGVQVLRTALPAAPQPAASESTFVSAPRSLEVLAAVRINTRTAFRPEPRAARSVFDADWHGVALANGTAGPDDVLTALAAEPVEDAPFFATTAQPEPVPAERDSLWQSAYVVIAALIGLGARHYFVRDDEADALDECTK